MADGEYTAEAGKAAELAGEQAWAAELDEEWRQAVEAARVYEAANSAIREFPERMGGMLVNPFHQVREVSSADLIKAAGRRLIRELCEEASKAFSAHGARLTVHADEYTWLLFWPSEPEDGGRRGEPDEVRAEFLPSVVWAEMRKNLEASGRDQSLKEAAGKVWSLFGMEWNSEVKQVRSGAELGIAIWTEPSRRPGGKLQFTYSSANTFYEAIQGLKAFMLWGFPSEHKLRTEAMGVISALEAIAAHGAFDSRRKVGSAVMDAALYKGEIKMTVNAQIAAKLAEFLAEFGSHLERRRC